MTKEAAPKFDPYNPNTPLPIVVGVLLIIVSICLSLFLDFDFNNKSNDETSLRYLVLSIFVAFVLIRLLVVMWVYELATQKNMDRLGFSVLSFFFPSIVLLIVGSARKRYHPVTYNHGIAPNINSNILLQKAIKFHKNKMYSEAIRYAQESIKLSEQNSTAIDVFQKSQYEFEKQFKTPFGSFTTYHHSESKSLLKIVSSTHDIMGAQLFVDGISSYNDQYISKTTSQKFTTTKGIITKIEPIALYDSFYIILNENRIETLGSKVFSFNHSPLQDGTYSLGIMGSKIAVRDGVIAEIK